MNITRARVMADTGEDEEFYFYTGPKRESYTKPEGYTPLDVPKMWVNHIGLHVQSTEQEDTWTVFPLHRVLWMEEVRP